MPWGTNTDSDSYNILDESLGIELGGGIRHKPSEKHRANWEGGLLLINILLIIYHLTMLSGIYFVFIDLFWFVAP